jgi:hypothetical protein
MTDEPSRKPCLHCLIHQTVDDYAAHIHATTGKPQNIHNTVDDMLAVISEYLAWVADAKVRKSNVKHYQDLLAKRVRLYREIGRYPGGVTWEEEANPG